jgi:alpha-ribazole phosphatase/probable phosphoglycerate mutase
LIIIDLIRHVKVDGEAALYGATDVAPLLRDNQLLLNQLIKRQPINSQLPNRQGYDVIVTSPLQRCRLLAQQLAKKIDKPLIYQDGLQEMNFGVYDGIAFDQIPLLKSPSKLISCDAKLNQNTVNWPTLEAFFQAPAEVKLPQAESLLHFNQRVTEAWSNLLMKHFQVLCDDIQPDILQSTNSVKLTRSIKSDQHKKPKRIALVTHGGVIRMILAEILAVDWKNPHWHQHLKIGYGSLTTITVTRPFKD